MPNTGNEADRTVESGPPHEGNVGTPGENARKPYQAPRLRYLGSVRELTAGGLSFGNPDGDGTRKGKGGGG